MGEEGREEETEEDEEDEEEGRGTVLNPMMSGLTCSSTRQTTGRWSLGEWKKGGRERGGGWIRMMKYDRQGHGDTRHILFLSSLPPFLPPSLPTCP